MTTMNMMMTKDISRVKMKTQSKPSKKKFVSDAFKLMIAAGSMAGTVGIWSQFANQEVIQASADTQTTVVDFQPLPTVVPLTLLDRKNVVKTSEPKSTTSVRDVTVDTTVQTNNNPALSSSSNNVITLSAPAPVTSTRSSRR